MDHLKSGQPPNFQVNIFTIMGILLIYNIGLNSNQGIFSTDLSSDQIFNMDFLTEQGIFNINVFADQTIHNTDFPPIRESLI